VTRSLLEVDDLTADELVAILDASERPDPPPVLAGRGVALVFEKPSNRTRNATEMAVVQLGGHPVSLRGDEVGLDVRETAEDVGRTLACYHAAIGCAGVRPRHAHPDGGRGRRPGRQPALRRRPPMQALADC
jgi:ornithine carbamoyltransferase